jgi:hypothetical protein
MHASTAFLFFSSYFIYIMRLTKKEIEKQLVFMVIQKAKNYQEVGVDWIRQNDLIRGLN